MDAPIEAHPRDPLWYKDAVIYEVHVRAFADSNNDGIGDFPVLTGKLDYIQDLGVNAIWLLPFYPSPLRDDGYDISDYRQVHPSYGSLRDFRLFLGVRVLSTLAVMIQSVAVGWQVYHLTARVLHGRSGTSGCLLRLRPPTMRRHSARA